MQAQGSWAEREGGRNGGVSVGEGVVEGVKELGREVVACRRGIEEMREKKR